MRAPHRIFALVAAAWALPQSAYAQGPARRFAYDRGAGAEACPTPDDVRGRILAHLGYDPFAPSPDAAAAEDVSLTVRREAGHLVARIERRDASGAVLGKRELTSRGADCAELAAAASFAIAFALDPLHAREDTSPLPAPAPPSPPAIAPPPVAAPRAEVPPAAPPNSPDAAPPTHLRLGATLLGALGAEPAASGAASVLVGVDRGAWSIDLEGRADLGATRDLGGGESVRAAVLAGSLVPCAAYRIWRGCIVASLGTLRGSAAGLTTSLQADSAWVAAGLRAGAELPVTQLVRARFFGELQAPLRRTSLVVDEQPVWTTPAVTGALGVGLIAELDLVARQIVAGRR